MTIDEKRKIGLSLFLSENEKLLRDAIAWGMSEAENGTGINDAFLSFLQSKGLTINQS